MWLRATSPTRASSTRLALRYISRPARHTARTPLRMDVSYSSSGRNAPRRRLPISATSPSQRKKQLSVGKRSERDFAVEVRAEDLLARKHLEARMCTSFRNGEGGWLSRFFNPKVCQAGASTACTWAGTMDAKESLDA